MENFSIQTGLKVGSTTISASTGEIHTISNIVIGNTTINGTTGEIQTTAPIIASNIVVGGTEFSTSPNVSGINTGDNAINSNYENDYRASNFIAGTNYQVPLVSGVNIKTINSQSILGSGNLFIAGGAGGTSVSLSGNTSLYILQNINYTITNYNSFSSYSTTVTAGNATITGNTISFTAPATPQTVTLTVSMDGNDNPFSIEVLPATVSTPSNSSPANGVTGQGATIVLTGSAFSWVGTSDTHLNSDWQVASDSGFTNIIQSNYADATNKTSWPITGLVSNTTYYWRVRYRGTNNGVSNWSNGTSFTTGNSFIATPSATPTIGDSFEGGFYAGMIWHQVLQSTTSMTIETGSKIFTVPDMTSTPVVYYGQTLEIRSRANPNNKFVGTVTDAFGTLLTINVTSVNGSGTFSDWSIMSRYRIIVAPKANGENSSIAIKNTTSALPSGCQTLNDGWTSTNAMKNADNNTVYPAAWWARGLNINSKNDWYIPARDELELLWRNLKPVTNNNFTTADRLTGQSFDYKINGAYGDTSNQHGVNNNSIPSGSAYSAGSPAQTSITAFKTGGAEAFTFGTDYRYWSSSEYNSAGMWRTLYMTDYPGAQNVNNKNDNLYVRAVRRSII